MTLAVLEDPEVAGLPSATSARPPGTDPVRPLRQALGLDDEDHQPALVLQAQALAEAHPASPVALARLAQAAQSVGLQERAWSAARAAIAAAGPAPTGSARFAVHAAALVLAAGRTDDAAEALTLDDLPGAAVVRASLAVDAGDDQAALAALDNDHGPLALAMRGWLMLDRDTARAVASLRAAAKAGLRSPDVLVNLGYGLARLGASKKAIAVTREATRLSPADLAAAYNLSVYLHRDHRDREALAELDRIADLRHADPDLAMRRAWAHVHLAHDGDSALKHLRGALDRLRLVMSSSQRAEMEASVHYLNFRLGRRSLTSTRQALWQRLQPSGPSYEVVRMLASLLTEPDDVPGLERLLAEAGHALRPGQLLVHRARLAVLEGRFDDAVALALEAVQTDTEDPDALGYAVYLVGEGAGRYARAVELYDGFGGASPEPALANNVALSLALTGDAARAARVIAAAGGAEALPFYGATAALVALAQGQVRKGLAGYAEVVRRMRDDGDLELADLVDWRRRLAMLQLGLALDDGKAALAEPPGTGYATTREGLRRVRARVLAEP